MESTALLIILRLIHVVAGACWVGAVYVVARKVFPAVLASGPAGGVVMGQLAGVRKLPMFFIHLMAATILSGILLYIRNGMLSNGEWYRSMPARIYGLGAAFAIVTAILGVTINSPTARKIGALAGTIAASGGPPSADQQAELARLNAKLQKALNVGALLLVLAAASMSVARYMP
ncbi:MAG: hypothetical protein JWO05_794 [Gemmatimonadetes bacterium]|nr:hypothetical protein [Gemmatimonadota bacterium]